MVSIECSTPCNTPDLCREHGCQDWCKVNWEEVRSLTKALEKQVGGDHYKRFSIQPVDVWHDWKLNPFEASALKYIQRRGNKEGGSYRKDIEKAIHYLQMFLEKNPDLE